MWQPAKNRTALVKTLKYRTGFSGFECTPDMILPKISFFTRLVRIAEKAFIFAARFAATGFVSGICSDLGSQGIVAERLGTGLQNLLQRFESARYLRKFRTCRNVCVMAGFCFFEACVLVHLLWVYLLRFNFVCKCVYDHQCYKTTTL